MGVPTMPRHDAPRPLARSRTEPTRARAQSVSARRGLLQYEALRQTVMTASLPLQTL